MWQCLWWWVWCSPRHRHGCRSSPDYASGKLCSCLPPFSLSCSLSPPEPERVWRWLWKVCLTAGQSHLYHTNDFVVALSLSVRLPPTSPSECGDDCEKCVCWWVFVALNDTAAYPNSPDCALRHTHTRTRVNVVSGSVCSHLVGSWSTPTVAVMQWQFNWWDEGGGGDGHWQWDGGAQPLHQDAPNAATTPLEARSGDISHQTPTMRRRCSAPTPRRTQCSCSVLL